MSKLHHDIRNQLQAILSNTEFIRFDPKEGYYNHLTTNQIKNTDTIIKAVNSILDLLTVIEITTVKPQDNTCSLEDPCGEVSGHSLGNHTRCLNCGQQFEKGETL